MEMSKVITVVLIVLLLVSVIVGGYFFGLNKNQIVNKPTPTEFLVSPSPDSSIVPITISERPTAGDTDNHQAVVAIKKGFETKDYCLYIGAYFDNHGVLPVTYAVGAVPEKVSPKEVCPKMEHFLQNVDGPWNFDTDQVLLQKLVLAQPKYFENAIVAISPDRHTVAFKTNDLFMIDQVFFVVDYQLLLEE
jgi:hypothetical protein